MTNHKQVHLTISGCVQGVFYRKSALEKAKTLDLKGFVTNEPNGSVRLVAQGTKDNLEAMIQWCHDGPKMAQVKDIELLWTDDLEHFQDFRIL